MRFLCLGLLAFLNLNSAVRAEEPLELYLDADFSINYAAAEAIELGVATALSEVGDMLGGVPVTLVRKDHRGNVKRSLRTMMEYQNNDRALAVIGGLHSPPYISNKSYINTNQILTLLPWSAGAPITRADPEHENWIFRVSVDDTKSGEFFVRKAVDQGNCSAVALVLLDTGWGRAGEAAISTALAARGREPVMIKYFPATLGRAAAGTLAESVAVSGADCAILMSNADNGAVVVNALHKYKPELRLFSHWGILGAAFQEQTDHETRVTHDLKVLQTCALRIEQDGSPELEAALTRAVPKAQSLAEIGAVTGFVHGYDLTRILIAATAQAAETAVWDGDISSRRQAVKAALEDLRAPVAGILKRYDRPFAQWSADSFDAHEALGLDDLCMARFDTVGLLENAE